MQERGCSWGVRVYTNLPHKLPSDVYVGTYMCLPPYTYRHKTKKFTKHFNIQSLGVSSLHICIYTAINNDYFARSKIITYVKGYVLES